MKKRTLVFSLLAMSVLMGIGFSLSVLAGSTHLTPGGIIFPDMSAQNTAWISWGNNIYYDSGKVGIWESDPDTTLHVSEPYDSREYAVYIEKGDQGLVIFEGVNPISGALDGFQIMGLGSGGVNNFAFRANAQPTGVYINKTTGFVGINTKTPEAALDVNGDLIVQGNMTFPEPAGNMTLPDPAYSSGWKHVVRAGAYTFVHNLGGDPNDYVVKMTCGINVPGTIPIVQPNNISYGLDYRSYQTSDGACWSRLDDVSIMVSRGGDDSFCPNVSVKIWTYQD